MENHESKPQFLCSLDDILSETPVSTVPKFKGKKDNSFGFPFAYLWENYFNWRPELRKHLQKRLRDKNILDLGCGPNPYTLFRELAQFNLRLMVAVDKFHASEYLDPRKEVDHRYWKNENGSRNEIITVAADMADFLALVKDESCSVTMNGVDSDVIRDQRKNDWIIKEIARVVEPGGIVFGNNFFSYSLSLQKEYGFKLLTDLSNGFVILEKPGGVEPSRIHEAVQSVTDWFRVKFNQSHKI